MYLQIIPIYFAIREITRLLFGFCAHVYMIFKESPYPYFEMYAVKNINTAIYDFYGGNKTGTITARVISFCRLVTKFKITFYFYCVIFNKS
jgi:hypothetical protein